MVSSETQQDRAFDIVEWRQRIAGEMREFAKAPFETVRQSGATSLFHYLTIATLRPAVQAVNANSEGAEQVIGTVQQAAGTFALPLVEALRTGTYQEEKLGPNLDEQLKSRPDVCRAIEQVMTRTDTVSIAQNIFATEEWVLRTLKHELQELHSRGQFQQLTITIPSEQYEAAPVSRGALKLEVSASKPTIVAGEEFSLFVVIRNPYQVPIVVYTVQTHIPVELVDMVDLRSRDKELELNRTSQLDDSETTGFRRALLATWYAWRDRARLKREPGARLAEAVGTDYKPEVIEPPPPISVVVTQKISSVSEGSEVRGVEIERIAQFLLDFPEQPTPEYLDRIMWRIEAYKTGKIPVLLQPGDSVVRQFVFRTRRWLLFTPLAHSFQIQVRYLVDGRDHMDTAQYDLSIQANIRATIIGAILGGTLGGVSRILVDTTAQSAGTSALAQLGSLFLAVILSAISVVSLARKSSVQPIISIEDFWGGLFLGFLIGYLGQNFAMGILSPGTETMP